VEASVTGYRIAAALAVVALIAAIFAAAPPVPAAPSPHLAPATASNLTGSISGPTVLAQLGHGSYYINATGGPAFAANGTQVGNLTFYATSLAGNTTQLSVTPGSAAIVNGSYPGVILAVNNVTQVVTISVEIASVYQTSNETINITYTVTVVQPYIVSATIVDRSTATVLSFVVTIFLDGVAVGTVTVPTLTSGTTYGLNYQYVTLSLSSGWHTFSMSLASEHGLVSFANGSTSYSSSFYIPGSPPSYELWYVAGIVAFFGVLFIFATRVAARRRGAVRR
jgi:hypothetical protein